MPRRQKIAIGILLFLVAFIALGDRYFPVLTKQTSDEPPVFGFLQILIPGGMEQLGRFCNAPETTQNAWSKKYYCEIKLTDRYLAFFTFWLAAATIGLGLVSVAGIWRQSQETRILQHAYLSAEPRGVSTFLAPDDASRGHRVVGHVGFRNVGRLPARNVRWFLGMEYSADGERSEFEIGALTGTGNIVGPGTMMTKVRQIFREKPSTVTIMCGGTSFMMMVLALSDTQPFVTDTIPIVG